MTNSISHPAPITITPSILKLVVEICLNLGSFDAQNVSSDLQRANYIRSVQSSMAIEGNALDEASVLAIYENQPVIGSTREIQEVRNALVAYEDPRRWSPRKEADLSRAHGLLMDGLMVDAGHFRQTEVGIFEGNQALPIAPPSDRTPFLIADLLSWLERTDFHPLVAGPVFHYKLEFIHPFSDGNGRLGRLWQKVILSHWNPLFAHLPVESFLYDNQARYYQALASTSTADNLAVFVEFSLNIILASLVELKKNLNARLIASPVTPEVTPLADPLVASQVERLVERLVDQRQVNHLVSRLLETITGSHSAKELMKNLNLKDLKTFRKNYLNPALKAGFIEMTIPDKPNSKSQKYRRA
ncbi:MAG: Fic family protein [Deltaproteobacteria bacterium]|jgi:Fic family protein|nr:Fic family protein [Deltaproteobacteria bacterium]